MKGEPPVTRLPSYAWSSPKIPVYAQAASPTNAPARRRGNDEERHGGRSTGFDDALTRVHIHTPRRSRRADTRDTRFVLFPSSHSRRQIFLEFVSGRLRPSPVGVHKRTRPSRVLFNHAYTTAPLLSAQLRLFLQLREKAVLSEREFYRSIGRESRLTIAARSTVRDGQSVSSRRNRSTGAKPGGSNNWIFSSKAPKVAPSGMSDYLSREGRIININTHNTFRRIILLSILSQPQIQIVLLDEQWIAVDQIRIDIAIDWLERVSG